MRRIVLAIKFTVYFIIHRSKTYFELVEEVCKNELSKKPNDYYSLWLLSCNYVRQKKYLDAQKCLEELVGLGANNRAVQLKLAKTYFNLRKYKEVKRLLFSSERLRKKDIANYYLGYSLIEIGEKSEGIKYLERYLKYHPKDHLVFCKLGYEYFMLENYEASLQAYRKAEKLDPSNQGLKESIELCLEKM